MTATSSQKEFNMSQFAFITINFQTTIINLDYVTKIVVGLDAMEPTKVSFADKTSIILPKAEGTKLIGQLNKCCTPANPAGGKAIKSNRKK